MKLVIPTNGKKGLDDKIAKHFGRCFTYTFLNEKGEVVEIIDNTSEHMGGTGLPPEWPYRLVPAKISAKIFRNILCMGCYLAD